MTQKLLEKEKEVKRALRMLNDAVLMLMHSNTQTLRAVGVIKPLQEAVKNINIVIGATLG